MIDKNYEINRQKTCQKALNFLGLLITAEVLITAAALAGLMLISCSVPAHALEETRVWCQKDWQVDTFEEEFEAMLFMKSLPEGVPSAYQNYHGEHQVLWWGGSMICDPSTASQTNQNIEEVTYNEE